MKAESVKILVVEDDLKVATVLEARLQSFGYEVCGLVNSGSDAIGYAIKTRPDLIIMDILLKGDINGIEAAESIHKQLDVPIVFLTCLRDRQMLDRAVEANAYGYIQKPYDNAELRYTIKIALIKYRAAKEREGLIKKLNSNIVERKRAEEALQTLNENLEYEVSKRTELAEARARQLQTLAVELIEAEENERRRVAEILHEDLQQILAAARLQLQNFCNCKPPEPMLAKIEHLLDESIGKSRRLAHELSPAVLNHSSLGPALDWLAGQMNEQFGLKVLLKADSEQRLESFALKIFLFRAVHELLFNAVKHAGVDSIDVALSENEGCLEITISDRGKGFDPSSLYLADPKAGFGLMSIRERAQYMGVTFTIESAPGRGSCFRLSVPCNLH